jgi:putative acetyltransferase
VNGDRPRTAAAFSVRAARVEDVDGMIAVFRASVHEIARRDYTAAQVDAWAPEAIDRAAWLQRSERHLVWVATTDTAILGGFIELADDGLVDMLYVHPAFVRQGVATALLAAAEDAARALGLTHLFTAASITARPCFERLGFEVIAPQTVHLRDLPFRNFRMTKTVASRNKMPRRRATGEPANQGS